jgi:hypothetical protein
MMEMERTGGDFQWRNWWLELDLQPMEIMDLEQNKNFLRKVIHTMWKRNCAKFIAWTALDLEQNRNFLGKLIHKMWTKRRDKIEAGPAGARTS